MRRQPMGMVDTCPWKRTKAMPVVTKTHEAMSSRMFIALVFPPIECLLNQYLESEFRKKGRR
jgi:hypothetical protein